MAIRNLLALLVFGTTVAFLGGCSSDSSMSDTVKPNPAMANRYKQSPGTGENPTAPKGDATAPK